MPLLPLAVDIAEIVANAEGAEAPLDPIVIADKLVAAHPEAEVSTVDILDAVIDVATDAGVQIAVEEVRGEKTDLSAGETSSAAPHFSLR